MSERKSDKDARGGPMKIVYAVIVVGIIAIIGIAFLSGRGPHNEGAPPVQQAN